MCTLSTAYVIDEGVPVQILLGYHSLQVATWTLRNSLDVVIQPLPYSSNIIKSICLLTARMLWEALSRVLQKSRCLSYVSAWLPEISSPWFYQAQKWGWLVRSSQSPPFHPFFIMGVMFPCFQSLGTSPDCLNFSNMMDIVLATTSADCLRIIGCISSGSMDLCMLKFLR